MTSAPALWRDHRRVAYACAREFFLPGADREDVEQECLIGLWAAARAFDPSDGTPFPAFATIVIRRRLASAVRTATRLKHMLLTDAVRIVAVDDDGQELRVEHTAIDPGNLEHIVITRDELHGIVGRVAGFSEIERAAIARAASGDGCVTKTLDNALQRARRKLREAA